MPNNPALLVAPMMEWTDRHCRQLHRAFSPNARLYTEMVTTGALLHGPRQRLLAFHPHEQPVALQLGGCDPSELADCAALAEDAGFAEVNLNIGCPSDRVQQARIGACLMAEPDLVAACTSAMQAAVKIPVTVKCRLGIDDNDSDDFLFRFMDTVAASGVQEFALHARIAILTGLSPAQNRSMPPLNYERIGRARRRYPQLTIMLNGGIDSVANAQALLDRTDGDGVMIGRAAYNNPWLLAELENALFATDLPANRLAPLNEYLPYVADQLAEGNRLHSITRHMLGVASGLPGARAFRRFLSENANKPDASIDTLTNALGLIRQC